MNTSKFNFKDIKIAFFDVDGTLIDMNKKVVSDKTVKALKILRENGVLICIASGRPVINMPKIDGIEFDAYLAFNGAYCYTKEKLIFKNPIPSKDVHTIIKNAVKINRPVSLATVDRLEANGVDVDLEEYYAIAGMPVYIAEDFDDLKNEEVYQIMCGGYESEYDALLKDVGGATITAWWHRAVDIIPADGGKGIGVEKILEHYSISKDESIAIGDGANDIEMLKAVGIGVAMGNAKDDVKAHADLVCKDVSEDGVYQFLKENKII